MTISSLKKFFSTELEYSYSNTECAQLFHIFAGEYLGLKPIELRTATEKEISAEEKKAFKNAIKELKAGKPYQQILGKAEFFGMSFFVDENVLIPRPETEELIELAIEKIRGSKVQIQSSGYMPKIKILDIGTGSGIIPIVLKKYFSDAEIMAIDISEKALEVARRNAAEHTGDIHFIAADYLNWHTDKKFDIIISNPPYIGQNENPEIENSVKNFEPTIALFSPTADPLIFYKNIAADAQKILNNGGQIFLEINQKLGSETLRLFSNYKYSRLLKDISGNDRFIHVSN